MYQEITLIDDRLQWLVFVWLPQVPRKCYQKCYLNSAKPFVYWLYGLVPMQTISIFIMNETRNVDHQFFAPTFATAQLAAQKR